MKKVALVLAVLMFAVPAWAGITVSAVQPVAEVNEVLVTYEVDGGDANLPRAFALDITVDGINTVISNPYDTHSEFYVYPGSIVISGGVVTSNGTPVASKTSAAMTIEMGSLYATNDPCHTSPPANSGTLFKFTIDTDEPDCLVTVSIAGNAPRGNVVMEDPDITYNNPSYVTYVGATDIQVCEPEAACTCFGDITDSTAIGPPDGQVDLGDFTRMSIELMAYAGTGYVMQPPLPGLECGDMVDSTAIGCPDGQIDLGDFTAMSIYLMGYAGTGYVAPCFPPVTPCP
jgi:hypothetical protein